jgi:hypothetical protein
VRKLRSPSRPLPQKAIEWAFNKSTFSLVKVLAAKKALHNICKALWRCFEPGFMGLIYYFSNHRDRQDHRM